MENPIKNMEQYSIKDQLNFIQVCAIILSICALYLVLEKYSLFKYYNMEKNINWHEITYQSSESNQVPCKRWGHKTVHIDDEIVLFGGFSDVTYLNDLWRFNIHTNKWHQIETTGKKPEGKSNFTMHYDNVTNQLIIFGGGGPNKRKFNKVSLLNWQTKVWTEHQASSDNQQQSNIPWQRTYHSSEFKYPYLIMFGGQGIGNIDLDDLWVFNIQFNQWTEIKTNRGQKNGEIFTDGSTISIEGRKFHSTALIDHEFFVIAGCRLNYSCISNIYSIDLSHLFLPFDIKKNRNQQNTKNNHKLTKQQQEKYSKQLNLGNHNKKYEQKSQYQIQKVYCWKKHHLKQKQIGLIQKWGHSSESYNGKIYIFGGRNLEDFNDLIEYDPKNDKLTKLISSSHHNKLPKSRRRHSSCMLGSSMIIFGGFNLEYFNDLQYISLFQCRDTLMRQNYDSQTNKHEIIQLQEEVFHQFMRQMSKDKPQYDIQLWIESPKHKQPIVMKSIEHSIKQKSPYFACSLLYSNSSNPEHKTLTISFESLNISILAFQIFNVFLIKDLLILPKNCKLKRIYELLILADYFMVDSLLEMIKNMLILKAIDQKYNIDDIFNIAANFKIIPILNVCAQKKILDHSYFNSNSKIVPISKASAKIKTNKIQEMLQEIKFDQIQKSPKDRHKFLFMNQISTIGDGNSLIENEGKRRKKSFMEKMVESFTKFCSSNSTQNLRLPSLQRHQSYMSDDDDDDDISENESKMYR